MALIGLKLPHEIARVLAQLDVPGEREAVDQMHITLVYMNDLPIEDIGKAIVAVYGVTSRTQPFVVGTRKITTFPPGEDGTPVICPVESPPLHVLRERITLALRDAGVAFSDKFPIYKPHVTLSYANALGVSVRKRLHPVEWGVGEVVLWAGNRGDDKLVATFPLAVAVDTEAKHRAFVRASLLCGRAAFVRRLTGFA